MTHIYLSSGGGTKSSNIGGGGGEDFPEGGKAAGPVQIYQLNTMSFDHDLPNVVQHKISSWIVFILWPTCVILQSEFAVGDHISTKYRWCQKCQKIFNVIHISWWYIFCHHLANLCDLTIWILSRRSSSCFRSWKPAITGLIINQLAVIALKLQKKWRTF